ncbi:DUF2786 domain-containing protein [Streptomyces sp. NRRL F-5123]|uniref:DUF2786 domain-containing protein n=1 Tax=Streptomyces sp. NRRL F-5123 TaxID=1463856 RepID=UPI0004E0F6B4|nr:DUF2786 domain-containing protein [Streptomyces sp. NRRL F-5123]
MEDVFAAAYARALGGGEDEVDAAASVLAAQPDWDGAAARQAAEVVRGCARRGWQPQDLVRMAARELGARHERLALTLTDDAPAPPGTAPGGDPGAGSRGSSGAGGSSGHAPGGMTGFARREKLDRFSAATVCVEVLRLYGRLPRLPALQAPGAEAAPPGTGKMLARIRALLAKAESTGFPEEAEALSAKAQHLMARHSIDAALLGAAAGEGPGARRIGVDRPYEGAKALLLDAVAEANRCRSVWSSDYGFATVVGHTADLDAAEILYTSLLVQADRALHAGRVSRSRDFRESFLIAYASRIRTRLTDATAQEESASAASAPELLPALASRALAVEDTTRRLFPSTTTSRLRARDAAGWSEGESAADRANLRGGGRG